MSAAGNYLVRCCTESLLLVIAVQVVSGCATRELPREIDPEAWQLRQLALQDVNSWDAHGHIAIKTNKDGVTASLHWRQRGDNFDIKVLAPFGRGAFQLIGDTEQVELRAPKQPPRYAKDPEALLGDVFGWSVPVAELVYWIRGLPGPKERIEDLQLDDAGRLSVLKQSGWQINVHRYTRVGEQELPAKLTLERNSIRVRLIVQKWKRS